MFCPECGTQNPPNAKFCNECGINLIETLKELSKIPEDNEDTEDNNIENSEIDDSTANPDNTENFNEIETDEFETSNHDVEPDNSEDRCIICKTGVMIPTIHRGSLGIGTKSTLECNKCGAVFEKKGTKYKLTNI